MRLSLRRMMTISPSMLPRAKFLLDHLVLHPHRPIANVTFYGWRQLSAAPELDRLRLEPRLHGINRGFPLCFPTVNALHPDNAGRFDHGRPFEAQGQAHVGFLSPPLHAKCEVGDLDFRMPAAAVGELQKRTSGNPQDDRPEQSD